LFIMDADKLWGMNGPLHCTNFCYLLRTLLVKSEIFKEEEVKQKLSWVYYYWPHQYLKIKLGGEVVNIDAWGKKRGIRFGDYAKGFHI